MSVNKIINVIIIDDSPLTQKILIERLSPAEDIQIVGTATDVFQGRDLIVKKNPDVLLLDIQLPKMDGLTFLKKLMHHFPMPVIMLSSLTEQNSHLALEAQLAGAVDCLNKPTNKNELDDFSIRIIDKIRAASRMKPVAVSPTKKAKSTRLTKVAINSTRKSTLIAIGSSTGGTQALERLLTALPANIPPIVIVQHMPKLFTYSFAERLNSLCDFDVKEAEHGDILKPGRVIIGKGDYHMVILNKKGNLINECK